MNDFLVTIAAGLVATGIMTGALYAIHGGGLANADMIRAIGSLITRREENALLPGTLVHFVSGCVFAFVYVAFWSAIPATQLAFIRYVSLGLVTGLGHGIVVSFLLIVLVAEHHPLVRFQRAGVGVAFAHLVGHVVYGAVVGIMVGAYGVHFDFIRPIAG